MALDTLDRTRWSVADALAHIEAVLLARRTCEESLGTPKQSERLNPWGEPRDPVAERRKEALEQLLVALRDGEFLALGRHAEERPYGRGGSGTGFGFHSGRHTGIMPEQWKEGNYLNGKLTAIDWEFIDIQIPRVVVKAIWPEYVPESQPDAPASAGGEGYTTPYLLLMQEAIRHFGLSAERQEKKDCLMRWFQEQEADGVPISGNLAGSMATLVRLPEAQRGGAKRVAGPDMRRAS